MALLEHLPVIWSLCRCLWCERMVERWDFCASLGSACSWPKAQGFAGWDWDRVKGGLLVQGSSELDPLSWVQND